MPRARVWLPARSRTISSTRCPLMLGNVALVESMLFSQAAALHEFGPEGRGAGVFEAVPDPPNAGAEGAGSVARHTRGVYQTEARPAPAHIHQAGQHRSRAAASEPVRSDFTAGEFRDQYAQAHAHAENAGTAQNKVLEAPHEDQAALALAAFLILWIAASLCGWRTNAMRCSSGCARTRPGRQTFAAWRTLRRGRAGGGTCTTD